MSVAGEWDSRRFAMEVVTVSGRAALVEWRIRLDWVEVWHGGAMSGALDRGHLRAWLANPIRPLVVDDVTLTLDRAVDSNGRIALTLPDVNSWTLAPTALADLTSRV